MLKKDMLKENNDLKVRMANLACENFQVSQELQRSQKENKLYLDQNNELIMDNFKMQGKVEILVELLDIKKGALL